MTMSDPEVDTWRFASFVYRPCEGCRAPIRSPFPDAWWLDMIKVGSAGGPVHSYGTPHLPGCDVPKPDPQPGIAVRVPGKYVTDVLIGQGDHG